MPLYEYQCDSCGARVERIQQKYSDPPLKDCPTCGGSLTKLMSSPAIQFKGSGWYITDYARKPDGEKGTTDSKDSKDTKDSKDSKDSKEKDSKGTKDTPQKGDGAAAPAASSSSSEPASGDKAPAATAPAKTTKD